MGREREPQQRPDGKGPTGGKLAAPAQQPHGQSHVHVDQLVPGHPRPEELVGGRREHDEHGCRDHDPVAVQTSKAQGQDDVRGDHEHGHHEDMDPGRGPRDQVDGAVEPHNGRPVVQALVARDRRGRCPLARG